MKSLNLIGIISLSILSSSFLGLYGSQIFSSEARADHATIQNPISHEFMNSEWYMDWAEEGRKIWYTTVQGSLVIPMDIFMTIDTQDGAEKFSSRKNLERYGWVYPPQQDAAKYTENGLPLGFVSESNPRMRNVNTMGFSCAACHTGQIVHGDKRYVIDGGKSTADFLAFSRGFVASLKATMAKPSWLEHLQEEIKKNNPTSPYSVNAVLLKKDFIESYESLKLRNEITFRDSPDIVKWGPGRLDAFTEIFNNLVINDAKALAKNINGEYINIEKPRSPIRFPVLWSVPIQECVQTKV